MAVHHDFSLCLPLCCFLNLVCKTFLEISSEKKSFLFLDSTWSWIFKEVHSNPRKAHSAGKGVWVDVYKQISLLSFEMTLVKVITQEIPMSD
jgi:hypothetical protein